jgi:hypothetical protein
VNCLPPPNKKHLASFSLMKLMPWAASAVQKINKR